VRISPSRMLVAALMLVFAAGPVSVAAAPVPASTVVAQASTTISGTVKDNTGSPVADARVDIRGAQSYSTTTDASGNFSVDNVGGGVYVLTISRPGFQTVSESDFAVIAGQTQSLTITLPRATLTSLQTIATVRSQGPGAFNTTPAAINVVTNQTFVDQAQPQVTRVVNQIPGVQISYPGGSANGAAPGSITFPNIRNAASYETASLIDGHPLAVGGFGDYVTTFLQSSLFGSVEVVKGPGADAPEVNGAIGGTINFRTLDPTPDERANGMFGVDSHGGTFSNFGISDTIGKWGFVADVATLDEPSALNGTQVYIDPTSPTSGTVFGGQFLSYPFPGTTQVANTESRVQTAYPLLACCYAVNGYLNNIGELLKLRYKFSGATTATVSYLGGQAYSDQNGNVGNETIGQFAPTDGVSHGSLANGQTVPVNYLFAGGQNQETNNEPIFQAEISTTLGEDTLLARYYHASINRLAYEGANPSSTDIQTLNLYGVSSGAGNYNGTFNGDPVQVSFPDFFRETACIRVKQRRAKAVDYQARLGGGAGKNRIELP